MSVNWGSFSGRQIGGRHPLLYLIIPVLVLFLLLLTWWKADDFLEAGSKLAPLVLLGLAALVFTVKPFYGLVAFLFILSLAPVSRIRFGPLPIYFTDCVLGASVLGMLWGKVVSQSRFPTSHIAKPVWWFLGLGIISNLIGMYIGWNVEELIYMGGRTAVTTLGFFLVLDNVRTMRRLKAIILALLFACVLSLILATWLVFSGDRVITFLTGVLSQHEDPGDLQAMYMHSVVHPALVNYRIRLPGWCATTYGGFLAMAMPAVGAAVVLAVKNSRKYLAALVVGAMFIGLILNYTRHGWIALGIGGIYLCVVYFKKLRPVFSTVAVSLAVVLVLPFATRFHERVATLKTPQKIGSLRGRIATYYRPLQTFKEHPGYIFFGRSDAMRKLYRHRGGKLAWGLGEETHKRANNSLLILMANRGVLGFAAFMWAFLTVWALAQRIIRRRVKIVNRQAADVAILLWGSLIVSFMCWFSDNYMTTIIPMTGFYWILMGLFASAYRLAVTEDTQTLGPARQLSE